MAARKAIKFRAGRLAALALLLAALALAWPSPAAANQARPPAPRTKQVLLLLSSNCGIPWYGIAAQAIRDTFQAAHPGFRITLHIEYAGIDSHYNEPYMHKLRELYQSKYAGARLDLIIAVADLTVDFLLKYRKDLFSGTPIVFIAEPDVAARVEGRPDMTGVIGTVRIKDNIELILGLHPEMEHLAVVSGAAGYDQFYEDQVREILKAYESRLDLIYLTGLTSQELLARLGRLPDKTVVLYVLMNKDGAGTELVPRDELPRIVRAARAPVYGMWDPLLGVGIVGGLLSSAELAGQEAARLGLRILRGEKPGDIPYVKGAYAHMFDWRQLRKWGIAESALPPGSIIRYQEFTFWDLYKWRVLLIALLLLLAVMLYIKIRTRVYRNKIKEQERVRELLENQVAERTAGLQKANAELARLSNIDGLTGLYNRRYFDAILADEWKRHARSKSPLSLIMGDLDFFKAFNDTYGHQAGDNCLQAVAQAIQAQIKRPADIGARYGGEEFALVLTNTASPGARKLAEDIRRAIKGLALPHAASAAAAVVTMSFGVATMVPDQANRPDDLVHLADQALYQSKHSGRDRVEAVDKP